MDLYEFALLDVNCFGGDFGGTSVFYSSSAVEAGEIGVVGGRGDIEQTKKG